MPSYQFSHRPGYDATGPCRCVCGVDGPCPVYAPALCVFPFTEVPATRGELASRSQRHREAIQQARVVVQRYTGADMLRLPWLLAARQKIMPWEWSEAMYYDVYEVCRVIPITQTYHRQETARAFGDMVRWGCELREPDGITPRIDLDLLP